ncbi:uncharacterized protein LOC141589971 [Silene latifolia]|uniref:uncharacterized protein LOC141589971 n=1 Tax=Silene latifolia TaxID=37657 RepID=UPI003D7786CF
MARNPSPHNKSSSSTHGKTKNTTVVVANTQPVISVPASSATSKTRNINEITRITPFDLDSVVIDENGEQWVVQGKKKSSFAIIEEEPADLLQFTTEDIQDEVNYWKNSVYCFILGANPPWDIVEGFVRRIWANYPIDKVSFLLDGIFLVRFSNEANKLAVLRQGHFLFDNKPLILREWSDQVELTKTNVMNVPVWIKLLNLPLKFWAKCLPRIAGLVGKYIRSDASTEDKTRLGFARVLLEVPFGKPLPGFVKFLDEDGHVVKVEIECEWKPILCTVWGGNGHESEICRKSKQVKPNPNTLPKQKRIPKKSAGVNAVIPTVQQIPTPAATTIVIQNLQPIPKPVTTPITKEGSDGVLETPAKTPAEVQQNLQVTYSNGSRQINTPVRPTVSLSRKEIIQASKTTANFSQYTFLDAMNNATPKVGIVSTNTSWHNGGRIWVLWNPSIFQVQFLYYSAQLIHMEVLDPTSNFRFYCTFVYAFNGINERTPLWEDLQQFSQHIVAPWVVCSDFNCVLSPSERLGGHTTEEEMNDFQACIDYCSFIDCSAIGSFYTWNNKQDPSTRVYSRLDRVPVNQEWLDAQMDTCAHFLKEGLFDHTPCIIQLRNNSMVGRKSDVSFLYILL